MRPPIGGRHDHALWLRTYLPEGHGETKDLRAQWALEETGLPYRVHALDHTGGELDSDAYSRISPFHQAPVIDDDGFVVAESAAVVLYLAEKAGKLIPGDVQGRTRVVQWCFAAVSTVEPTLVCIDLIGMFDSGKAAHKLHAEVRKLAPAGSATSSAASKTASGSPAPISRWPTS
jgi:glutathione S-transferase